MQTPLRGGLPIHAPSHILPTMWQVASSEKPARPRLALFVLSLALGCTLGAAWLICLGNPDLQLAETDQRPPYWPIRFQLPSHVKWLVTNVEAPRDASQVGDAGLVAFQGIAPGHSHCILTVGYETNSNAFSSTQPAALVSAPHSTEIDSIDIGPLVGKLYIRETRNDLIWLARAWTDDGLMLEVELASPYYSPDTDALLRDICHSIEYQDWWLPKPELWPVGNSTDASEVTS